MISEAGAKVQAGLAVAIALSVFGAATARGQSGPDPAVGDATSTRAPGGLDEIIVTATKRAVSLQEVPVSVSVLNEELLAKQGATDFVDIATMIPNLSFGASAVGPFTAFNTQLRGIAASSSTGLNGTTGFYIDDVPMPQNIQPRVIDILRVEVLRGPQGSLYGARSMGGTVRMITKRADPTSKEFEAHVSTGKVAEGGWDYSADTSFNLPISDTAAFRGNVYYIRETGVHDMVIDNPYVAGDEHTITNADNGEYWGLQAMVTWDLTDNFTIEPRLLYQDSHLDWLPYSDVEPGNFSNHRFSSRADPNNDSWGIASLTLTWDTDWGQFTSATALFERDVKMRAEFSEWLNFFSTTLGGDPTYYPPGGILSKFDTEYRNVTEELRFVSEFDGRLQVTAGVFYAQNEWEANWPCTFAAGFADASGLPFGDDCLFFNVSTNDTEELAIFGEVEYAITDNLLLTVGGRYFDSSVEASAVTSGVIVDFGAPPAPGSAARQDETGFNPKVALKWNVSDDWMLYSSASKGFRAGGVNNPPVPEGLCGADLAAIGLSESPTTYDSDSLWNYEIGSKSTVAGGRLSVNAAAFFIDWQDIIQQTVLPCSFGFIDNTGEAESKGFELEVSGNPIDSLSYSLGVGYTDAEITDPGNAAGISKGDPLAQVPEWTVTGNAEYRFPVGGREGYFFLSYRWMEESVSFNVGPSNPRMRDAYDILDARFGLTFGNWDVSLFAENLANEHANLSDVVAQFVELPGRPRFVINRPRTVGIDVRWHY